MTPLLASWLEAGVPKHTDTNVSPIRLTNMIALIFLLVLVLQIPLSIQYWSSGGDRQLMFIVLSAVLCPLIPLLNHQHRAVRATWLLLGLFSVYLLATSFYLGKSTQSHYFFLIGVFMCPFVYDSRKQRHIYSCMTWLVLCFLVIEFMIPASVTGAYQVDSVYQDTVGDINLISFVITTVAAALSIHLDHAASWRHVAREKRRSETLLLNILPSTIAQRLKHSKKPIADYFEEATVLFADIEGFSQITRERSPDALVAYLNDLYTEFDYLLNRHGLEKIKTNGDQYMAVSGVPTSYSDHASRCCHCAIEMRDAFRRVSQSHGIHNGLRIGINSGDLIAGVIGKNKFSYDIWGDNVNLAARMESHGKREQIQVSESTFRLCKDEFECVPKGSVSVKGMGEQTVYWLKASD